MESGTKLSHYEISTLLGKGGMGEVWRARDTKLGREVAIKTLPEEFAQDTDRLARFEREAKLLASLNHPNVAAIHGFEEDNGTHFRVLELVEGDTLADRLSRGAIPAEESLKLALQIAEGLEAAHEKGIVHRDLKPGNIKVTPDGKVKVLDFGLAKALAGDADVDLSQSPTLSMQATQQGIILGTSAYMSPEQVRGETADRRVDVWAFGCLLFEMLTGLKVFKGRGVSDVLASVLKIDPDWNGFPLNLHSRIRILLERCLEKEVKDRYQAIADARVDVQKVLDDPNGVFVERIAEVVEATPQSKLPWVATFVLGLVIAGVAVWNLKPEAPAPVSRFSYVLPEGQESTTTNIPLLALSPDGSRMVYAVNNQQLYMREMDSLESSPIPGTDENPAMPFFSPDGQSIAYWSGGQLKKIDVNGGIPVSLAEAAAPRGAIWGTDGNIVFHQPEGIMQVSANGGTPELLVAVSEDRRSQGIFFPQVLPDGESVLSQLGSDPEGQIVVQSLESGERKVLFPGTHPRYVPSGHIVYGLGACRE